MFVVCGSAVLDDETSALTEAQPRTTHRFEKTLHDYFVSVLQEFSLLAGWQGQRFLPSPR